LTNLVRSQATSNPEVKARPGRLNEPSQGAWILMLLAMAMSLLWPVVHGSSSVRILSTAGWLCLIFLGAHLQIFLHELGHLLVAWSLRFRSRKIQVGAGRALWSGTFASGFQFEWRLWPEAGLLWAHNLTTRNYRVRHSLFIAGGPMMDALIVSLGYMLIFRGKPEGVFAGTPGSIVVGLLFVWTAIGLAGNLIPRTVWVRGQELRSDGNILWTLWTSSNRQIAQIKAQVEWQNRFQTCEGDQIREALGFGAPRPAPVNAQESLATFSRQQTRLTSRLLPQR
jgi:Peptidase family M50